VFFMAVVKSKKFKKSYKKSLFFKKSYAFKRSLTRIDKIYMRRVIGENRLLLN